MGTLTALNFGFHFLILERTHGSNICFVGCSVKQSPAAAAETKGLSCAQHAMTDYRRCVTSFQSRLTPVNDDRFSA
jgi:hypothetical protein